MMNTDEKIIYVITKGEYSDYHICAATTNRERAEKLRKFYMKNGDEVYIEELIDGAPEAGPCENLKTVYGVLETSSGEWLAWLSEYSTEPFKNSFKFHNLFSLHHLSGELKEVSEGKEFKAYVMAEDEEHAIKIAQDQMAKMLAEKEGL